MSVILNEQICDKETDKQNKKQIMMERDEDERQENKHHLKSLQEISQ